MTYVCIHCLQRVDSDDEFRPTPAEVVAAGVVPCTHHAGHDWYKRVETQPLRR